MTFAERFFSFVGGDEAVCDLDDLFVEGCRILAEALTALAPCGEIGGLRFEVSDLCEGAVMDDDVGVGFRRESADDADGAGLRAALAHGFFFFLGWVYLEGLSAGGL